MFSSEQDDQITSYTVQKLISAEKQLMQSARTPEDDWRCEKCENVELLLKAIKTSLNKARKNNLSSELSMDSMEFVTSIVCSVKSHDCCNDVCSNCPRRDMLNEVIRHLKSLLEVSYNKWVQRNNIYEKAILCEAGVAVADQFDEIATKHFKLHVYNIFGQYSELKFLEILQTMM